MLMGLSIAFCLECGNAMLTFGHVQTGVYLVAPSVLKVHDNAKRFYIIRKRTRPVAQCRVHNRRLIVSALPARPHSPVRLAFIPGQGVIIASKFVRCQLRSAAETHRSVIYLTAAVAARRKLA